MMFSIVIKRVYAPHSAGDGTRILVDRLWPRGLRKDGAFIDFWNKNIAPTASLRTWFDHRADRFAEFKQRYVEELRYNPAVEDVLTAIGAHKATLLYAAHDEKINHAVVLAAYLTRANKSRFDKRA